MRPTLRTARPRRLFHATLLTLAMAGCDRPVAPPAPDDPPKTQAASAAAARDAIDAATSAILRGTADEAVAALAAVPGDRFAGEDATFRACMLARFGGDAPPVLPARGGDAFVAAVLERYRTYWWQALKHPERREALEADLLASLRTLLGPHAAQARDFDAMEPLLDAALLARGVHAQSGRTPPLRELMLWRSQTERAERVQLPEGAHAVTVALLDDFLSLGWSAYGRCERGSAGGWATAEKLYAIVPAYAKDGGLDSETFRVVFLGHEAQHFADQNRWPDMAPWELEYRAKLVELVQAHSVSAKRLRGFLTAQGDDPDSPHTYANRKLAAALGARLGGRRPDAVPLADLQDAARAELLADTARRR